jgi:rifampicin phosphotransferase
MEYQAFMSKMESQPGDVALVVPLETLDRTSLLVAGGKAANLGELINAGFAVPVGFCVTTAAYALVSAQSQLQTSLSELEDISREESARKIELATAIRAALCQTPLPADIVEAITRAYQSLSVTSPCPVSVRSSAITEDLPFASFAGQQDTFLNVIGIEAVLASVQRCFASLWNDRAEQYRTSLGIAPRNLRLAVVVQRMVEAEVAGVLFTANPLTGKRHEVVIDANPGLGEAVASGATNPDHFVVQATGQIAERQLGDKQVQIQAAAEGGTRKVEVEPSPALASLSDAQIRELATLGQQVEALYKSPQDIEWAIGPSGKIFLLQARPITSLFPLPDDALETPETLSVYLAFGVQQGTYRPFTPLGISALRLLASGFLMLIGHPSPDPLTGPSFIKEAASRPFFDVTTALRSSFGRLALTNAMREAEIQAAHSFELLGTDPRLSIRKASKRTLLHALFLLLVRTLWPWYLFQAWVAPHSGTRRVNRLVERLRNDNPIDASADAATHLASAEHLLLRCLRLAFRVSPVMVAGIQSFGLARRMLGDLASESECQTVLGGSPANPTVHMNLALWKLSQDLLAHAPSRNLLQSIPTERLVQQFRQRKLPPPLQDGLARFLQEYGHQGVCELDLGVAPWSEDPTYVLNILISYLEMGEDVCKPDLQIQRSRDSANTMIAALSRRANNFLHRWLVRFLLQHAHTLAGFREMTRFFIGLVLSKAREHLRLVGEALVRAEKLTQADDIFFLAFPEVHKVLAGADLREVVGKRRVIFARELGRRHVPLVLLSDGTDPTSQQDNAQITAQAGRTLQGTPASAGRVRAPARVILDPNAARLEVGEILVAPSTDPAWTPLFLKASGLVMEVGGAMAHGAIVAREYGIPAVVSVARATQRITTGNYVTLDGGAGSVLIEENVDRP